MLKKLYLLLIALMIVAATGCSSTPADTSPLSEDETATMLTDADQFSGRTVTDLPLEVFQVINEEDGNYQYQAWADPDGNNSVIIICREDFDIAEGDFLLFSGTVDSMQEFENAFGATLEAPVLVASGVEISDATIFNPAQKTITVGKEINQHGIVVTLQKIEFAENSTRVYLHVANNSSDKIDVYEFDSYIKFGSKQYTESEISYDEATLDISSMVPGTEDEGLLSFEPIDPTAGTMTISISVSSEDWELDLNPYNFSVTIE